MSYNAVLLFFGTCFFIISSLEHSFGQNELSCIKMLMSGISLFVLVLHFKGE